jgi:ABC-type phosphate/phosphonate transport system substrate-binding protein
MYDWPEVRWANDALWSAIVMRLGAAGITASQRLERSRPFGEEWRDPGLVLSQTCGWPYAAQLAGVVRLVATPVYAVEGCEGPLYSSAIVVRHDAPIGLAVFRRRRFAFNSRDSLSGYVAFVCHMAEAGLGEGEVEWVETGSHRASVRAVAEGRADVAAIDAVAWALAQEHEAAAARRLRVLGWTARRPGLPLITAGQRADEEVAAIRDALFEALAAPVLAPARAALFLAGAAVVPHEAYAAIQAGP